MKTSKKKINGIWFYGYSGAGKSYACSFLKEKIKNSIIIDGDIVRKLVSNDLKFTIKDRSIQNIRVFGIAQIIVKNNYFPLVSSVFLSNKIYKKCKKKNILVVEILRDKKHINRKLNRKTNVVGKDLKANKLQTIKIENSAISSFKKNLLELIK